MSYGETVCPFSFKHDEKLPFSPVPYLSRQQRMTGLDFLSQVGGLLGLCIGFSFCSGVEILYWFLVRIPFGCRKTPKD